MRNIIVILAALVAVSACTSATKNKDNSSAAIPGDWAGNMQRMSKVLDQLMPYVFSRNEFHAAYNRDKVGRLIDQFSKNVHVVEAHVGEKLLGDDPMVKYNLDHLKDSASQAQESFRDGHTEYARNVLASSVGTCFNCHTTTQLGPETGFSTTQLSANFRLYPTEKADFYVATRQYDHAIEVLESVLKNPTQFEGQPHEQVAAIKKYLSIMVRVKADPARAAQALDVFLTNGKLPYFVAVDTEGWLKSLRTWQREKKTRASDLSQARSLLARARKLQSTGTYQAGYVENLRATRLLHDALKVTKNSAEKAQIYSLLGESYNVVADLGVWGLPEVYFESCVRTHPQSPLAKRCYQNYERAIILGFSGSAGVMVPSAEKKKLSELKALAGL